MVDIVRVHIEEKTFTLRSPDLLPSCAITPLSIERFGTALKTLFETSPRDPYFLISQETYRRLQAIDRMLVLCPVPPRLLRKYQMRKLYARRKAIRRRYL